MPPSVIQHPEDLRYAGTCSYRRAMTRPCGRTGTPTRSAPRTLAVADPGHSCRLHRPGGKKPHSSDYCQQCRHLRSHGRTSRVFVAVSCDLRMRCAALKRCFTLRPSPSAKRRRNAMSASMPTADGPEKAVLRAQNYRNSRPRFPHV